MRERNSPFQDQRLPPLNSLRVFEAAARHGNFARAADELHVTHGAVSRQIRQLEEALGQPLFERRNRAVFLTASGHALHESCADVLARVASTWRQLQARAEPAPLVLSCEPTIAMRWLIPRQARCPVRMHLLAAGGPVDFARDRIDVALRRDDFRRAPALHAEPVAAEWMGPVCTPGLAKALLHPRKDRPLRLLHSRTRPQAWPHWLAAMQHRMGETTHESYEHFYLSLQAAGAGLGVAMASWHMVRDDIEEGRLAAPLGFWADGSEYFLMSPAPVGDGSPAGQLLAWLRTELNAPPPREIPVPHQRHIQDASL
ncbi:LysR family transcriptional regulator [Ottowia testudinis]|uniref:LysR family transcriptional regulator n=1 Tax=Ottowia testudinis TaxID=2816950 RepID=A0A975CIS1_9BURK|nr:LysR family transcriptional regulator [Ottowia testudinis]QTD47090.1 LysR family transcriptional regulator [Ottowia testudinis]